MTDYDVVWNEEDGSWDMQFSGIVNEVSVKNSNDFPVEVEKPVKVPVIVKATYVFLVLLGLVLLPVALIGFINLLMWAVSIVASSVVATWAVCGTILVALAVAMYRSS